jgi:hypothetical protein
MLKSSRRDQIAACKCACHEAIKGFECAEREYGSANGTMGYLRNKLGSKAAILRSLAIRDTPSPLLKIPVLRRSGSLRNFNQDVY